MRGIVTVIGKDRVGIIAAVSECLTKMNANIEDISQTIMQDYFVMIMMVDISKAKSIAEMTAGLEALGDKINVKIRIQHEDIFNAMHKI